MKQFGISRQGSPDVTPKRPIVGLPTGIVSPRTNTNMRTFFGTAERLQERPAWQRERCLGFPPGFTRNVLPKDDAKGNPQRVEDIRLTLLGNTWGIAVVAFLLLQLLRPLGLCVTESLHQLLSSLWPADLFKEFAGLASARGELCQSSYGLGGPAGSEVAHPAVWQGE